MTRTTYDDVFGGPPKFAAPTLAPRPEDYTEIFGGFHAPRASSIPVLDLPVVDNDDVFFDVQSSGFDYDEVFGGFNTLDSAVSFHDLMMDQSKGFSGGDVDSSDEDWTQAETDSLSEESDQSGKNQCLSNRDSYESIDGSREFNISYHKANQRSDDEMPNGITHVTQIHAVPGYTFLVNKATPLGKAYCENPPLEVTDDSDLHMDFGGGMMREKNLKKSLSQPFAGSSAEEAVASGLKPQKAFGRNSSLPNETFVTVSEISLRTQPSEVPPPCRPAPPLGVKMGDSGKIFETCKTTASEGINDDTSPPVYDVEVDTSSSAAASAAAMKEVMEKAEAKLKAAKELLEKKREGVQSCKHDRKDKDKEGKMFGTVEGSRSVKKDKVRGTCERQANGMTFSVREERQRDVKTTKAVPDTLRVEEFFTMDRTLAEKHGRSGKIVGAGEWKEASEFFELVKTDGSTFEQANYDEGLEMDAKVQDCRQKTEKEAMEHHRVNGRTMVTKSEDFELEENEKKLVAKEACELTESNRRSGAAKATRKHKGHEKQVKVAKEGCDQVVEEKNFIMVQHAAENEKKPTGADVPEKHENLVKDYFKESKFEGQRVMKHRGIEQPLRETNRSMGNETRFEEPCDTAANGRRLREAGEQIEDEKKVKKALDQEDKEKVLMEDSEQEDINLVEANEREESTRKVKEALEQVESEKTLKEACELGDAEKRLRKALEQEANAKETFEREETERRLQVEQDIEEIGKRLTGAHENEETGKSLGQVCEQVDNFETLYEAHGRREENEMRFREALEKEASTNFSQEARVETEKSFKDAGEAKDLKELNEAHEKHQWDEYGKKLKMAEGPQLFKKGNDMASGKACMLDDNVNLRVTRLASQQEVNTEKEEVTQGAFADEGNVEIQIGNSDSELEGEAVETTNVLDDRKFEVFGLAHGNLKQEECKLEMKDVAEPFCEDHCAQTMDESGTGTGQEKTTSGLQPDASTKNQEKNFANEWGERENNIKQTQVDVGLNQKLDQDKFMPAQLVKESAQNGRKMEAAQQSMLGRKGSIQNTAQSANASESLERREKNVSVTLTSKDKDAERVKRQRELEIERLRRIEEEREREREREKDRMAVDIATLEARERAFAEARERAERAAVERATAEVRQRALAEARERLEKACAEAKEKSLAEKTSMEARLRAERAAVERATAEARERAAEKAMAERGAFDARERVDRIFSEKFSASSRNSAVRPSSSSSDLQDQKCQSASSFSSSRYPYSSGYVASINAERSDGIEGESAQRCKARLERHRRTAERAANALAEKNMRDLLAQREQAERNRLAETLDADVKRWSSGKEGNLRALLSTLQYILGPDSGWHPIPLTEVITSAAVKKAYRKATLCVHPDKLQQRGASIQQKYICEKVFDLLKEAWNKFNSEER